MSNEAIMQAVFIPAVMTVALVYLAIRVLVFKDLTFIHTPKPGKKLKDEEQYRLHAGRLLLVLAAFSGLMLLLLFVNPKIAMPEMLIGVLIVGFLWKDMHSKYGDD